MATAKMREMQTLLACVLESKKEQALVAVSSLNKASYTDLETSIFVARLPGLLPALVPLLKHEGDAFPVVNLINNLAADSPEARLLLAQTPGLLEALISLVNSAGDNVRSKSVAALSFISQHDHTSEPLRKLGVVPLLERVLRAPGTENVETAFAVMALANLVGEKEEGPVFDREALQRVLDLLQSALDGVTNGLVFVPQYILFPLAKLVVSDANKPVLCELGVVDMLKRVLTEDRKVPNGFYVDKELEVTLTLRALTQLAFIEQGRQEILDLKLGEILLQLVPTKQSKELQWLLNGEHRGSGDRPNNTKHIMLSYSWSQQSLVKEIAAQLKGSGFHVWLDLERMKGSTLQAMADAIEGSVLVLMCVSKSYKESVNCRLEAEYTMTCKVPIIPLMMETRSPDWEMPSSSVTIWLASPNFPMRLTFFRVIQRFPAAACHIVSRCPPDYSCDQPTGLHLL